MINPEDIIHRAKINGYFFYYDKGFISVFDDDVTLNKNAQCLYRNRVECESRKDFELEAIYASSKVNEINLLGG